MELWRLDKILAFSGAASRRDARQLVRAGRVTADGVCPPSPEAKYDPERTDVAWTASRSCSGASCIL